MIEFAIESIESQRKVSQAELDAGKTAVQRNRLGQFATPNGLAVDIACYVKSILGEAPLGIRFADPSIGSGSFFSAALAVFGSQQIVTAVGVELDPAFANVARTLWGTAGLDVVLGDFTQVVSTDACPTAPNVILANPPYVRHHHMSRVDKERLQALSYKMTGVEVNGLAGLYVHFLLLATAWMEADGIAAWLIPSEFMDVNYGASLKAYLSDHVTLIRVHRFDPDEAQFGDALVSSVVVVFRKTLPTVDHAAQFSFGGSLVKPHASDFIKREKLREARKWTAYPCHAKNDRYILSADTGPRLGDFFRVQRGIATGCNKFFILDRAQAQRLELPSKYLRPVLPSPRHLKITSIDTADDGYPVLDQQLCVIDCDLPEALVETKYPALWEYLQTAQSRGVMDGYLITKRSPWYKQEQRAPAPFLCTYMGRGSDDKSPFRFVWNRSQAIGTNLYLMLYPLNNLAEMLRKHPDRAGAIHALLGQVTGHELRGEGRVYGGGLNKIEPSELARISAAPFASLWPELLFDNLPQARLFN